jgi:hypothetical protein
VILAPGGLDVPVIVHVNLVVRFFSSVDKSEILDEKLLDFMAGEGRTLGDGYFMVKGSQRCNGIVQFG